MRKKTDKLIYKKLSNPYKRTKEKNQIKNKSMKKTLKINEKDERKNRQMDQKPWAQAIKTKEKTQ